jgi:phosphoesterase RecJ-like protein
VKPNASFESIANVMRQRQRFAVMSHFRPDGDALGCSIAMGLCLRELGKEVAIWNHDGLAEKFTFLPGAKLVERPPKEPRDFDAVLMLDTAIQNRVGDSLAAVRHADTWINIDHHVSNEGYGDLAYIDTQSPAAGQILYELFTSQNLPLTPAMADNLFVAISTDTGSFQYPNTTARTYQIGSELIARGVKVGDLSQKMYESYPRRRMELLRAVLNALRFSEDGRTASFSLTIATTEALKTKPEDTEGLIDYIRSVEGVIVAAFFEELPEQKIRVSLRSKDPRVDVCKICGQFGGGGHILASGARISGSLHEVEDRVLAAIAKETAALP